MKIKRLCATALMVLMALDVCPWSVPGIGYLKQPLSIGLEAIGLRQGQWAMFAPNPVINNGWVTADMTTASGERLQWESPIWSRASGLEKFLKFRSLNYFNRIVQPANSQAVPDLQNYLARNAGEPIRELSLFRNQLTLISSPDGSLTPRQEAQWQLTLEPWMGRRKLP